jgi:acylphosphatase
VSIVTVRRRVRVSGRVQGVWFRESCRREADARGVAGWVRNCPDGKVEAAFEGEPDAVEALVGWCSTGPIRARVVRVEVIDELPAGDTRFTIR